MDIKKSREEAIQKIAWILRNNPFTFEFVVKKHPKGVKVIYEVTQEHMDAMIARAAEKQKLEEKKEEL